MPKFTLSAEITVSAYTEVEADTLEEAIEIAEDLPGFLSFNGCEHEPSDGWMVEEVDGSATNIHES